jgi:hypothetical protein
MGFLGQFESLIGELQRSFRMPLSLFIIAFFVMFGGGTMSARCKFVLLGGFGVCVVHAACSLETLAVRDDFGGRWEVRAGFARG